MSRLTDALDQLSTSRPPRNAEEVLAAARTDARPATARRGRVLAVAAAIAAIAAIGWWAAADHDRTTVRTGDEPTTTSEPTTRPNSMRAPTHDVFFTPSDHVGACDEIRPSPRQAEVGDEPSAKVAAALGDLGAGPNEGEQAQGMTSWFSSETGEMLESVEVRPGGVAWVSFSPDLASTIPNASTACGSAQLLAQLEATATQFPEVVRAVFTFDGDPEAFANWLQRDPPDVEERWSGTVERDQRTFTVDAAGYQADVDEQRPEWAYHPERAAVALLGPLATDGIDHLTVTSEPVGDDQTVVTLITEAGAEVGAGPGATTRYTITFDPPVDGPLVLTDARWAVRCSPDGPFQEALCR